MFRKRLLKNETALYFRLDPIARRSLTSRYHDSKFLDPNNISWQWRLTALSNHGRAKYGLPFSSWLQSCTGKSEHVNFLLFRISATLSVAPAHFPDKIFTRHKVMRIVSLMTSQVGRGLIRSIVASSRLSDSGEDAKVKDTLACVEGAWK